MSIEAYIPCRNERYRIRMEEAGRDWSGIQIHALCGYRSFYQLITEAIRDSEADYLLFLHDDLIFPADFDANVFRLIVQMNQQRPHWGLAGNFGNLFEDCLYFIEDPGIWKPQLSNYPHRVAFIDGNTMLLNRRAFIESGCRYPVFDGFHGYDMFLALGCLEKGLGVYATSELCSKHLSGGEPQKFVEFTQREDVQAEIRSRFKERGFLMNVFWFVVQNPQIKPQPLDNRPTIHDLLKRSARKCREDAPVSVSLCFWVDSPDRLPGLFENLNQIHQEDLTFDWSVRLVLFGDYSDDEQRRFQAESPVSNLEWRWISPSDAPFGNDLDDCRCQSRVFGDFLEGNTADYYWFGLSDSRIDVATLSLFGLLLDEQGRTCLAGAWKPGTFVNQEFPNWRFPNVSDGLFPAFVVRDWFDSVESELALRIEQVKLTPDRASAVFQWPGAIGMLWFAALMAPKCELLCRSEKLSEGLQTFSLPNSDKSEWAHNYSRYKSILGADFWNYFCEIDDRARRWKRWFMNIFIMRIIRKICKAIVSKKI